MNPAKRNLMISQKVIYPPSPPYPSNYWITDTQDNMVTNDGIFLIFSIDNLSNNDWSTDTGDDLITNTGDKLIFYP